MNGTAAETVDRLALLAATFVLLLWGIGGNYESPQPVHFAAILAGAAGLAAIFTNRRWAGLFILVAVLGLAVYLRASAGDNRASDVMITTNEALQTLGAGHNPYTHTYLMSNPPGSLFGYPPGEIIYYGVAHLFGANVFRVDVASGIFALGLIASFAPMIGDGLAAFAVAVLAASPDLIFHSSDGSNDTAAAFLVIAGITALTWSVESPPRARAPLWWISAIAFGWAAAFKEYTLPIAVFTAIFVWRADARSGRTWSIIAAGTAAVFIVPFFIWSPAGLIANVGGALITHENIWGRNFWHDAVEYAAPGTADQLAPVIPVIALLAFVALCIALWRRPAASVGGAVLQGCALIGTVFVLARWTTSVYYVFLAPVVVLGVMLAFAAGRATPTPPPPH